MDAPLDHVVAMTLPLWHIGAVSGGGVHSISCRQGYSGNGPARLDRAIFFRGLYLLKSSPLCFVRVLPVPAAATLRRSSSWNCSDLRVLSVDQLGLAGFFREELGKSDAAANIADADSPATRGGMEASSKVDNKYTYFVSYSHTGVNGRQLSFGNAEVVRDAPVQSMEDVEEMGDAIADIDEPVRDVVVLNWQVLRSPARSVTSG
jgi:hypothetical protein